MCSPVHLIPGIPVENRGRVLRSVHRSVQLAPQYRLVRCVDSKAHLPTSAPLSGPGTRPGIRPVARRPSGRSPGCCGLRFPAAFRPPAFASWTPCPASGIPPPLRSAYRRHRAYPRTCRGPWQRTVYTFHTRETRTGLGALYAPGTAVFIDHRPVRGRRLPPLSGRSLSTRRSLPNPGCSHDEASARVSW
jgi:hypothetical protein